MEAEQGNTPNRIGRRQALCVFGLGAAAVCLSSCQLLPQSEPSVPEPDRKHLVVAFGPSGDPTKAKAGAKPVADFLSKKCGFEVHVAIPTDYSDSVSLLGDKSVDAALLPPYFYVLAREKYGVEPAFSAQIAHPTTRALQSTLKANILVRSDAGIKSVSELKGKKIAFVEGSATGHLIPGMYLKNSGVNPSVDLIVLDARDEGTAVKGLTDGKFDVVAVVDDIRPTLAKTVPDVDKKTSVLATVEGIPTEVLAIRKGFKNAGALRDAFRALGTPEAVGADNKPLLAIIGWDGLKEAKDDDYKTIRDALKALDISVR